MVLQNLIFDLGGVIIDLDYNATARAFNKLGISDFDAIYSKAKQTTIFNDFEKGIISNEEFRNILKAYLPADTSDEEIDAAWNAMLLGIPSDRMEFLKLISKKYRIFLLSNTNRIHEKKFTAMSDEKFGKGRFESIFEKYYYSCELGMRKPDAEIFEKVLNENNLMKEETLFIDDSIQHIEGAMKIHLPSELLIVEIGEKIEEKYKKLLI